MYRLFVFHLHKTVIGNKEQQQAFTQFQNVKSLVNNCNLYTYYNLNNLHNKLSILLYLVTN